MTPGPRGFALARFPGSPTERETEQPNIALPGNAPAAAVRKRPAAASDDREVNDASDDLDEAPCAVPLVDADILATPQEGPKYRLMQYKKTGAWAIRECFGERRQLLQVGRYGSSGALLKRIASGAMGQLEGGSVLDTVKAWVKEELAGDDID